jgi:hypothetical protein
VIEVEVELGEEDVVEFELGLDSRLFVVPGGESQNRLREVEVQVHTYL